MQLPETVYNFNENFLFKKETLLLKKISVIIKVISLIVIIHMETRIYKKMI
jgi:hypothetical protein